MKWSIVCLFGWNSSIKLNYVNRSLFSFSLFLSLFLCTTVKTISKLLTPARKKKSQSDRKKEKIFNESLFFSIGRLPICDSVTCFCRSIHRRDKNIRKTVNRDEDYTRIVMSGRKKKNNDSTSLAGKKKIKTTTTTTHMMYKKRKTNKSQYASTKRASLYIAQNELKP